jgi:hypothetical protein
MVLVGFNGQKNTVPSGFKGQKKNFFDFSTFAFYVEKLWSWSGSKVKKTFSTFGLSIEKNTDCSSSKVMGGISETMSIEISRCYAFPQDHID